MDFSGTKVALLFGDKLIMQLRDNKPGLRFANMWDFPGGGRENQETPEECAIREVEEELGITVKPESFVWKKEYSAMHDPNLRAYFLVGKVSQEDVDTIIFGDEGQRWDFMDFETFFAREDVVPDLKERFKDYLNTL